jgi:hypothetical protein
MIGLADKVGKGNARYVRSDLSNQWGVHYSVYGPVLSLAAERLLYIMPQMLKEVALHFLTLGDTP